MLTRETEAALVDIEEQAYHAMVERQSNSLLGLFAGSRREYWEHVVLGEPRGLDTEALAFGKLFHAMLLEPREVLRRYVSQPQTYRGIFAALGEDPPAKINRKDYDPDALANANQGDVKRWRSLQTREIVKVDDLKLAATMARAIRNHPEACDLIFSDDERILREQTIFWTDEETGEPMRCRLDVLYLPGLRPLIVDVKTIREGLLGNDRLFRAHCYQYGYHRQAAVYLDAYRACFGVNAVFAFVFVEKRAVRPAVAVKFAHVDDDATDEGRDGIDEKTGEPVGYRPLLRQLQRLRASNDWRYDCERGVQPYNLPEWRIDAKIRAAGDMPLEGVG